MVRVGTSLVHPDGMMCGLLVCLDRQPSSSYLEFGFGKASRVSGLGALEFVLMRYTGFVGSEQGKLGETS